jgi:hypothetical protein
MDAGVGFADPSIVDRITTGVDVTADNTTHRSMSPPTPNAAADPSSDRGRNSPDMLAAKTIALADSRRR